MPVHIKGLVLKSRVDFLQRSHGEGGWERLLAELSPETRSALADGVLISSWYPLGIALELVNAADRMFGKGDLALAREMGRHSAQTALQGAHQSFARENDPSFVMRMAPLLWTQNYDSGRLESIQTGPTSSLTRVFDFEEPHAAVCLAMVGWIEAAIEIWGGTDVKVEERKCRLHGAAHCEIVESWTDPAQSK
jgi:hypothetical protein